MIQEVHLVVREHQPDAARSGRRALSTRCPRASISTGGDKEAVQAIFSGVRYAAGAVEGTVAPTGTDRHTGRPARPGSQILLKCPDPGLNSLFRVFVSVFNF